MPVTLRAGMRYDPETGEPAVHEGSRAAAQVLRARAAATVTRRADGSRHARLGNAFRSWTVATINEDGNLTQDCVSSEAEARARVDAAARKQVNK
jgi:hypothetical protein